MSDQPWVVVIGEGHASTFVLYSDGWMLNRKKDPDGNEGLFVVLAAVGVEAVICTAPPSAPERLDRARDAILEGFTDPARTWLDLEAVLGPRPQGLAVAATVPDQR